MGPSVPYRRDLDGLRALAVLAVVAFHAAPRVAPGGFVGVDVFFVVSGFLITSLVVAQVEAGRFTFRDFYARRARRLLPALSLVLAAVLVAGWGTLTADQLQGLGRHVVAGALFVPNVLSWSESGYFGPSAVAKPLLHLWSLGVEEQFYLLWPVVAVALARWPRVRLGTAAALAAGSFALAITRSAAHPAEVFFLPHTRLWEPMVGALLALALPTWAAPLAWRTMASSLGLAAMAWAMVRLDGSAPYPNLWALLPTAGAALVIAGGADATPNRALLSRRWPVGVGLISYPLYLWHWPLLSFGALLGPVPVPAWYTAGLVALSFLLATATWGWIERPVRTVWSTRPATVGVLLVLVGSIAVGGAAAWRGVLGGGATTAAAERRVAHALAMDGVLGDAHARTRCTDPGVDPRAQTLCEVGGDRDASGLLVVWGDSHADAWSSAWYAIGEERHLRVMVFAHGGCPPLLDVRNVDGPDGPSGLCIEKGLGEAVLSSLRALHPDRVVLVARWSLYANGWTQSGFPMPETHFVTRADAGPGDRAASRAAIASSLPETVAALRAFTDVTIQRTWPQLKLSLVEGLIDPSRDFQPTLAEHREREAFTDGVIDAIRAADPGVRVIDPSTLVCDDLCHALVGDELMYVDDNHPTRLGTMRALPLLEQGL